MYFATNPLLRCEVATLVLDEDLSDASHLLIAPSPMRIKASECRVSSGDTHDNPGELLQECDCNEHCP